MVTIKAKAWPTSASFADGKWEGADASIVRFLNNTCVPSDHDEHDAVALASAEFVGVEIIADADSKYVEGEGTAS